MRKLTVGALQFSFTDKVNWNIKPMVKMRKVTFRGVKKKVTEFYGELVMFENLGLWLMLPAQEVVSLVYPKNKYNDTYKQLVLTQDGELEWLEQNVHDGKSLRIEKASEGIVIKEADFFMGKCKVELSNPLKLQGCTAVLVKYKEI